MTDPWSLYWSADHLQSCVPADGPGAVDELDDLWRSFATELVPGARVLDLATGNGVVPLGLLRARGDLAVTGVDRAAIDPTRFLSAPGALAQVRFVGGVDLGALPTGLGHFDAVTSQFGVEYMGIEAAAAAVAAHLAPGGRFLLLVHRADSAVVAPRRADLAELDLLLAADGPAGAAGEFAAGALDAAALEALTHAFMGRDLRRTPRLTGQVVQGVDRLLACLEQGDPAGARLLAEGLAIRVRAERARLRQLADAALDEAGVAALGAALAQAGLHCAEPRTLEARSGERTLDIGWVMEGSRDA
ncbi:MAG TPA: class I SAM-dependent methyltransferase [Pseudomonadales bacterium]|nr:class I SAM-dependent methyltransferase [Pseudomonadales bacterium]